MNWVYKNFTKKEMACKCGCGMLPTAELMDRLQALRNEVGFKFVVTSAARCPKHNATVSDTGNDGPHTLGLAVDIACSGASALRLVELAPRHGFGGIGIAQKGPVDKRYVHLDICGATETRPRPWLYSY